jgi:hypothetical protein
MRHLGTKCVIYLPAKRKTPQTGEVVCGAKKRTPGKIVRSSVEDGSELYLEIRRALMAANWARANRASMGANVTLPPRRRRTIIPASWARVLATPCALGRISVTVEFAFTSLDKATAVPARGSPINQSLAGAVLQVGGLRVTRIVTL